MLALRCSCACMQAEMAGDSGIEIQKKPWYGGESATARRESRRRVFREAALPPRSRVRARRACWAASKRSVRRTTSNRRHSGSVKCRARRRASGLLVGVMPTSPRAARQPLALEQLGVDPAASDQLACVPRSTMRPSSTTTIRSASFTVEIRCAMRMVVRSRMTDAARRGSAARSPRRRSRASRRERGCAASARARARASPAASGRPRA